MNGYEELVLRQRGLEPIASCSTPLNQISHNTPGFTSSSLRPGRRPKGLISDEDQRMHSLDAGFGSGGHGNAGLRPRSGDYSRNTSSSSSPVNLKDSLERLQRRSASLSSDDVVGLSHESSTISQSSLLPRSSTLSYEVTPPTRSTPRSTCPRPGSPGSEMVTLEQFLEESNTLSPPTVHTGSREDLMTDYFTKVGRPTPPMRDGAKTPTSYVTPTIKATASLPDGRSSKPGHSVKPSIRLTEGSMPLSHSQTLPNRGTSGSEGRSMHLQHSGPRRGTTGSNSLNRTFSLASADLLQSNGPDKYRPEAGSPVHSEGMTRRERPLSARLTVSSGHLSIDPRRHTVAPPREDPPLTSSCTALPSDRGYSASSGRSGTMHSTTSLYPRGEVALVTPVRAVSALRQKEVEEHRETMQSESPSSSLKKADSSGTGCCVEERPMSTPASPDPNNDQQTVWYEYGCV